MGDNLRDVPLAVVIPLYNKRAFIKRTLASVSRQIYPAAEIIVVDDGSTDGSFDEIACMQSATFRIERRPNMGPGAARNYGFALAQCPWVALLDGDDLWAPDHLATLAALIREFPTVALVGSAFRRSHRTLTPDQLVQSSPANSGRIINYFREAADREVFFTSTVAIRREAFERSGGFGSFLPGEDEEFWARMALAHSFAVTPKVTAIYTVSTGGQMDIACRNAKDLFKRGLAPVFDTLDRALDDPRHITLHASIQTYRNKLLVQRAKNALYNGRSREARWYFAIYSGPWSYILRAYQLMTCLPGPIVRFGSYIYSKIKFNYFISL